MNARFALVAAVAVISTSAFAAEAPRLAGRPSESARPAAKPIVLASVDTGRLGPAGVREAGAAPKRPNARVTTCRCGGQPADEDGEAAAEDSGEE